ncbi:hypothetical protein Bpfe_016778, partial [Biomphalaria pfeifferi]
RFAKRIKLFFLKSVSNSFRAPLFEVLSWTRIRSSDVRTGYVPGHTGGVTFRTSHSLIGIDHPYGQCTQSRPRQKSVK